MTPTVRTWWLLWGWLALAWAVPFVPAALLAWAGWGLGAATLLVLEGLLLGREAPPTAARTLPRSMALGNWHDVQVDLRSGARPAAVWVRGALPAPHDGLHVSRHLALPAEGFVTWTWRVRPTLRGTTTFPPTWLRVRGRFGLLWRTVRPGETQSVRVYPDFRRVAHFALMSRSDRSSWLGLHQQRRRGEGLEFHQLREYRPGDSLRQIDWKAVSRRRELVSREYQEERNQQIVVLLDCGRRMRAVDDDLSHFDHALNAVLLLAFVGLRTGDAVGLMTFAGEDRWLPPVKGGQALSTLLDRVYDLQTTRRPTDYVDAARRLMARQRRRALVVVVSNLGDADGGELPQAAALLRRRHVVVHASLRETVLDRVRETPVSDLPGALRLASTHALCERRRQAHEALQRRGVHALDVAPSELPAALVDRYLAIKRAGVL